MRKLRIVDDEAWGLMEDEWVPLDCYRDPARRCTRWCAAWQEEVARAGAASHVECVALRAEAWVGELVEEKP